MSVIRWRFQDAETDDLVILPLNPKEMTSPYPGRELAFAWSAHAEGGIGRPRIFESTNANPVTWSFTGVILVKSHHDLLLDWTRRLHVVRVTDHLERTFEVLIQNFEVAERQRSSAAKEWRSEYTMTCLVLREVTGMDLDPVSPAPVPDGTYVGSAAIESDDAVGGVASAGGAVVAVGGTAHESDTAQPGGVVLTGDPGDVGDLKPALKGLITTDPSYRPTKLPYADFCSTKPRWKDIETSRGVYNFTALDNMLDDHPGIMFRLRFMAGIHAPDFVKTRSGGAIQHDPSSPNGGSGLVPRFWTENYYQDYMAFMAAVADHFEDNPQVVEIPNSLTTTVFAEPFILAADSATIDRYWQAGYRKTLVRQNLLRSIAGMMDLFPTTRISLACHNKWEFIVQGSGGSSDGQFSSSWPDERDILNDLIDTHGPHLVLEDHGLGPEDAYFPTGEPRDTGDPLYAYMSGLRSTDQSYGWQFTLNGGSMVTAADHGVAMKACFLEYAAFEALDATKRLQVHNALLANAAGKP